MAVITPEEAQLIAAGGLGGLSRIYIRRPKTVIEAGVALVISMAGPVFIAPGLAPYSPFPPALNGYLIGLLLLGVAAGLIRAVERFDFSSIIGKGKE